MNIDSFTISYMDYIFAYVPLLFANESMLSDTILYC
jgi:hypothetical protein